MDAFIVSFILIWYNSIDFNLMDEWHFEDLQGKKQFLFHIIPMLFEISCTSYGFN